MNALLVQPIGQGNFESGWYSSMGDFNWSGTEPGASPLHSRSSAFATASGGRARAPLSRLVALAHYLTTILACMRDRGSLILLACLLLGSAACATRVGREQPLAQWTPEERQRAEEQLEGDRSPELLVLLAFSGGGTRAAAFSYGVLQELAATEVMTQKGPRPLHHEVDVISSVSGGSFTSAYFGLRGDAIFEEFEERFLRKNIEGALIGQFFNPLNWPKLMNLSYGRSDIAAEYYSKHVFDGATFADLERPGAPAVVINATDLGSGMRFPFYRAYFDLICADIDQYPVSRAVAASSAVPGLLSPISLESYAGRCGYQTQRVDHAVREGRGFHGSEVRGEAAAELSRSGEATVAPPGGRRHRGQPRPARVLQPREPRGRTRGGLPRREASGRDVRS